MRSGVDFQVSSTFPLLPPLGTIILIFQESNIHRRCLYVSLFNFHLLLFGQSIFSIYTNSQIHPVCLKLAV